MDCSPDKDGPRIPIGQAPRSDESLPGWLKRTAAANGHDDPVAMLRPYLPGFGTLEGAARMLGRHMAGYLALEDGEFDRLCMGNGPTRRVMGHELHADLVAVRRRKICPLCMEEDAYHRATWDLTISTVCPRHAVRLTDRCGYGHRLDWGRGALSYCNDPGCSADLRGLEVDPVAEGEMAGARGIDLMIRTGGSPALGTEVDRLPVGERVLLVFHLGLLASGRDRVTRPAHFANASPGEVHVVLDAGWRACADWPRGFEAFLDDRRAGTNAGGGRYGMRNMFGRLHAWVERRAPAPFASLVQDALHRYLVARPDLATRAPAVSGARSALAPGDRRVTLTQAKETLGVGFERLARVASARGMFTVAPSGKGAPALLRADAVDGLREELAGLWTKEDVRRTLRVGKKTVDALRAAGLLPAVSSDGPEPGWLYPGPGVDALMATLEGKVMPGPASAATLGTAQVARLVSRPGFDTADVVAAVMEGRLVPVSARGAGLSRIRFDPEDAARFAAGINALAVRTWSITEAAAELGVNHEAAYAWAERGLLETVAPEGVRIAGRRVTADGLKRFDATYVTGGQVAAEFGLDVKWAGRKLAARGVVPVSGKTVDGCRQYLFRRADVADGGGRQRDRPATMAVAGAPDRAGLECLRSRLALAAGQLLGVELTKRYGTLVGPDGVMVQAFVAPRRGVAGRYDFHLTGRQIALLDGASRPYVALGFAGRDDFLFAPWNEARALLKVTGAGAGTRAAMLRIDVRSGGGLVQMHGRSHAIK